MRFISGKITLKYFVKNVSKIEWPLFCKGCKNSPTKYISQTLALGDTLGLYTERKICLNLFGTKKICIGVTA